MDQLNHSPLKGLPEYLRVLVSYLFAGKPPYIMLAPQLFEHLRARGIPVWFMLVNHEKELDIAYKNGATAVLTDRGGWLVEKMREKNIHFQKIQ